MACFITITSTNWQTALDPCLIRIELIIAALSGNQFIMGSSFLNLSRFNNQNLVSLADSTKAVRNYKSGASLHQGS